VSSQLALNLRLRDSSSFDNFAGTRNREALDRLHRMVQAGPDAAGFAALYLWGERGAGKTHLLEAACRAAHGHGLAPVYIPLHEAHVLPVALIEDIEHAPLVCLDDLQFIAGNKAWEAAVFALYERLRSGSGVLLTAASVNPVSLGLGLADLATRLSAGLVYQLHLLTDDEKVAALCRRSANRGMEMPEEVARYLLTRFPRDMHALFELLERIDRASLAAQRRITIPFVRGLTDGAG
jgi:DnaA family protein